MTWTTVPADKTNGYLVTQNDWNNVLVGNMAHVANMVLGAYWGNFFNPSPTVETVGDAVAGRWVGAEVGDIRFGPFTEDILADDGTPLWLLCDGQTGVGKEAVNGEIKYAGDQVRRLFNRLYDTPLPMFRGQLGNATAKVNQIVDWAESGPFNARWFYLPDLRGRMPLGKDNLGGSSANRVTDSDADEITGGGGDNIHRVTNNEMPVHAHGISSVNSSIVGNGRLIEGANTSSGSMSTESTGGFNPSIAAVHNNMPPWITVAAIIYTGN